jgi:hypothetical protein
MSSAKGGKKYVQYFGVKTCGKYESGRPGRR